MMNCPKCGRQMEEGELTAGDGCMYCCYSEKSSTNRTSKNTTLSGSFSEKLIAVVLGIVMIIGMTALVLWGFLWLLSGGTIFR